MITDSFLYFLSRLISFDKACFFSIMPICKFFLLKLETKRRALDICSWLTTSSRTRLVAVAVNAIKGIAGKSFFNKFKLRYAGRKSCPHSEIQWASSTAIKLIGKVVK